MLMNYNRGFFVKLNLKFKRKIPLNVHKTTTEDEEDGEDDEEERRIRVLCCL